MLCTGKISSIGKGVPLASLANIELGVRGIVTPIEHHTMGCVRVRSTGKISSINSPGAANVYMNTNGTAGWRMSQPYGELGSDVLIACAVFSV